MKKIKSIISFLAVFILSVSVFAADWYVCLGSFKSEENAKALVKQLKESDIESFIYPTQIGENIYNRVLFDEAFPEITEARNKAASLENSKEIVKLNIKGLWPCSAEKPVKNETVNENDVPLIQKPVESLAPAPVETEEVPVPDSENEIVPENNIGSEVVYDDLSYTKTFSDEDIKLLGNVSDYVGLKTGSYKLHENEGIITFTYVLVKNQDFDSELFEEENPEPADDATYYLGLDDSFNNDLLSILFCDEAGYEINPGKYRLEAEMKSNIDDITEFILFAPEGKEIPVHFTGKISFYDDEASDEEKAIESLIDAAATIEMNDFDIVWYETEE